MENTFRRVNNQQQTQTNSNQQSTQPQQPQKVTKPPLVAQAAIETPVLTPQQEIQIKKSVVHALIQESHASFEYIFMLLLSVLITTLGLIEGSASVVIGGMLLAPLMSPILAFSLSLITTNKESSLRSGFNIIKSLGIILIASTITAFIFGANYDFLNNFEVIARINPSLLFMYIAILSGIGAAFTWAKPHLSARLPGIAVAVALVPPLCVTGIGLSILDKEIIIGSLQLFLVNLLGITGSSAIVFAALGFYQMKYIEKQEIRVEKVVEEQKRLREEAQKQQSSTI